MWGGIAKAVGTGCSPLPVPTESPRASSHSAGPPSLPREQPPTHSAATPTLVPGGGQLPPSAKGAPSPPEGSQPRGRPPVPLPPQRGDTASSTQSSPPPRFSAASPGTTFQSLLQPLDVHDPPGRLPPSPRCSPPPAPPPLTPRRKPGSSRRAPHTHAHTHTQTPGSATLQHGARAVPVRGPDSPPSPSRRGEGGGGRWRAGRRGRGAGRGDREGNGGTAVRGNGGTIGSEVYGRSLRSLLGLPLSLIPAPPRRSSGKGMGNAELLPEWRRLPAPAPQGDCAPSSPPSG